MKLAAISLGLFVAVAFAQTLTINTPTGLAECEPALITWSGGSGPFFVTVLPGGDPTGTPLQNLGQQSGTSLTWLVDLGVGTSVGFTIRDSTGATASSAPVTITAGTSSTCSGGATSAASASSGSASGASSSTPAATTGATPATTPATSPTTTATTPASSAASSGTGTKTASGGSSTGGASVNTANLGAAGVIGAAIMAILA